MALELRTEYPLDHKAATGAPVIAQESFGLHEVFSVRKKRSKVVTRQNARPFYTEGWVFLLAKSESRRPSECAGPPEERHVRHD